MATIFVFLLGVLAAVAFSETFRLVRKEIDRRAEVKRQLELDRKAELSRIWTVLDVELASSQAEIRRLKDELSKLNQGLGATSERSELLFAFVEQTHPWTFGSNGEKFLGDERLRVAA